MTKRIVAPSLTHGRQPIITLGDSIDAAGYWFDNIGTVPNASWIYQIGCYTPNGLDLADSGNVVVPLGPIDIAAFPAYQFGTWKQELGRSLVSRGCPVTFIDAGVAGTQIDTLNPSIDPTSYGNTLAFLRGALSQLPRHRSPVCMIKTGSNGIGTDTTFQAGLAAMIAALRTDLGVASMPLLVWRLAPDSQSPNSPPIADIIASQNTFIASDAHAYAIYDDDPTYEDVPEETPGTAGHAAGIHPDQVSAARAMVGPDSGTTLSAMTVLQRLGVYS